MRINLAPQLFRYLLVCFTPRPGDEFTLRIGAFKIAISITRPGSWVLGFGGSGVLTLWSALPMKGSRLLSKTSNASSLISPENYYEIKKMLNEMHQDQSGKGILPD